MQQLCPNCHLLIEIDETKYKPGTIIYMSCPRCGVDIDVNIPQPVEESDIIVQPITNDNGEKQTPVDDINEHEEEKAKIEQEPVKNTVPVKESKNLNAKTAITQPDIKTNTVTPPPRIIIPTDKDKKQGKSKGKKFLVIALLLLLPIIVFGLFYYNNEYLPEKRDKEAPRYYTFANSVVVRSSPDVSTDKNRIHSVTYGTELITYNYGAKWSNVKVEGHEGYIASNYILNKKDFYLLNSIFADTGTKEVIETAKCRLALLNYFKENKYIGKIDAIVLSELFSDFVKKDDNQWQVFARNKESKINTVYYKRISNPNSKFTDFAVIIQNIITSERKILIFSFKDDESPYLIYEDKAPKKGYIKNISAHSGYDGRTYVKIDYAN